MKLKMLDILSSNEPLQSRVDSKDQIASAIKALNVKQNREYLQKSTQLGAQEIFAFDSRKKSELNSLIADPNAPASLRQAAHYLVYNASSFEHSKSSDASFSFK